MGRYLISGASGLIGGALAKALGREGAEIVQLVRGPARNESEISWNGKDGRPALSPQSLSGFEGVIHLAGESIVGRWTESKRKAIRESRVRTTRSLAEGLAGAAAKPKVFVSASAIGFYGNRDDEILTEQSAGGKGFLAEVSREWEDATQAASAAGIRVVHLRTGVVLSSQGGALGKMLTPFKLGLGGRIGSGKQWYSWIHIDDEVGAIRFALGNDSLSGPINLTSPNPVRNSEFTQILAKVLGRPAIFPVPRFALALAFGGEAADELFLASQRVEPAKLEAAGYRFQFPELQTALANLV